VYANFPTVTYWPVTPWIYPSKLLITHHDKLPQVKLLEMLVMWNVTPCNLTKNVSSCSECFYHSYRRGRHLHSHCRVNRTFHKPLVIFKICVTFRSKRPEILIEPEENFSQLKYTNCFSYALGVFFLFNESFSIYNSFPALHQSPVLIHFSPYLPIHCLLKW
jgi:hypothetical protein